MFARTLLAVSFALSAMAQIVPTSPSGGTVVNVGQDIQALWTTDSTGQWTDVEVQLMTGDNFNVSLGPGLRSRKVRAATFVVCEVLLEREEASDLERTIA